MISKTAYLSSFFAGLSQANLAAERTRFHDFHPRVQGTLDREDCSRAVDRLMYKPDDVSELITNSTSSGNKWVDSTFTGTDVIYYPGITSDSTISTYDTKLASGDYAWADWQTLYTSADIFDSTDSTPSWKEPRQGGAGTCYLMSALSGVAEFPDIIKNMFVTKTKNVAGATQVKFYIRGKPWILNVDGSFLYKKDFNNALNLHNALKYALINTYETDNTIMWAPILEKAWAKIKGNYEIANGGFIASGLNTLSGAPVFSYSMSKIGSDSGDVMTLDAAYTMIKNADDRKYIMGAGTNGGSDTTSNACGLANGHAYSILSAFTLTATDGTAYEMLMFRNPWGNTNYNYNWGPTDSKWTANNNDLKDKMIAMTDAAGNSIGFDPTLAQTDDTTDGVFGVFVMDKATWGEQDSDGNGKCLQDFSIAHQRDGFQSSWFDRNSSTQMTYTYYVQVATSTSDLYFSIHGWFWNQIPSACQTGTNTDRNGNAITNNMPETFYKVTSSLDSGISEYKWYGDQGIHYPILLTAGSYTANTNFTISVDYSFAADHPAKDYTVRLYSTDAQTIESHLATTPATFGSNMLHMDGSTPSGFKVTTTSSDGDSDSDSDGGSDGGSDNNSTTDGGDNNNNNNQNTTTNPGGGFGQTTGDPAIDALNDVPRVDNVFDAEDSAQLITSADTVFDVMIVMMVNPVMFFTFAFNEKQVAYFFAKFF